jgi:kynurenine formamidase
MKLSMVEVMENYRLVDLTHTLEEGMPRPQVPYGHVPWKSEALGDSFNTFMLVVFEHTGTHVDAPIHLAGTHGATIDRVSLDKCMGPICCLGMTHKREREFVTRNDIQVWEKRFGAISAGDVVLLNLGWECNWRVPSGVEKQPYLKDNPGLHPDAALYLVEKGVKLVGGDIPTIDSDAEPDEPSHRILLPKGILILENISNLDQVPPKGAYLIALPLKIGEGTGSPTRAIALVPRDPTQK